MIRQRNILISEDSFTTNEAKINPKKRLPTSPIKTLAFGKLRGRNPRHADNNTRLKKVILFSSAI